MRADMAVTTLSSKGQIIIPKPIRTRYNWLPGQKFETVETSEGILLKPAGPFPRTNIEEVASCLTYTGPVKSLKEMADAISEGVKRNFHDRS